MSTPTPGGPGDDPPPYRSGGPAGWVQPPAYGPTGQPVPPSPPPGRRPDGGYDPYQAYDPAGQQYDPVDQRHPVPAGMSKGARTALMAAGMLAVAVAGSVGGWMLAGGRGPTAAVGTVGQTSAATAPGPSRTPSGTVSRSPVARASVLVSGAAQVDPTAASAELRAGGVRIRGTGRQAWTWNDTNGRNLLVLSKDVTKQDGEYVRAATLYVTLAAGANGEYALLRRPLVDPGTKDCDVDFGLDFMPGSVTIGDANADGFGEASVGWWASCRGDAGPYTVKLALLSRKDYWILRGQGRRASDQEVPGVEIPAATFVPSAPASTWPKGSYEPTVALFRTLYK